jgi:hypothetical protein
MLSMKTEKNTSNFGKHARFVPKMAQKPLRGAPNI